MKIKVALLSLLIAVTPTAQADGKHRNRHYNHYDHYPANYYDNGSDSDDAAWAVGGLLLGAILFGGGNRRQQSPNPPPARRVMTCYDTVEYDTQHKPYVQRVCYETTEQQ